MKTEEILDKLGIQQLTDMQVEAMNAILRTDDDVVLLSPTGSGKTLAYLLPLVQMLDAKSNDVQAVVIVPGRELALQSSTVLKDMKCGLRACACYGGRASRIATGTTANRVRHTRAIARPSFQREHPSQYRSLSRDRRV